MLPRHVRTQTQGFSFGVVDSNPTYKNDQGTFENLSLGIEGRKLYVHILYQQRSDWPMAEVRIRKIYSYVIGILGKPVQHNRFREKSWEGTPVVVGEGQVYVLLLDSFSFPEAENTKVQADNAAQLSRHPSQRCYANASHGVVSVKSKQRDRVFVGSSCSSGT